MSPYLGFLLLALACTPLAAQTSAADPQQQWPLLQERLAIVDAAAGEGDAAALERLQARQAMLALPEVRSRDRAFATSIAELRVSTAESALKVAQLRQQLLELDRERDAILLEASRRDAEMARKEAERLRLQALAREEEEALLNADAALVAEESASAGAALAAKDGELARLEEELAALANARGDDLVSLGGSGKGRYRLVGTAFLAGKATLQPEARQSLSQLGKRLKASGKAWSVEGFSDNLGSEDGNLTLSRQRAEAVMAVLRAAGIPAAKLSAKGWGSAKPVASNAGKSGRAQNRRVEIIQK
ncbi:OmpA family protein [Arenimonas sp.]|jgi:outer membrane protein OmpA-like peptidoglycan-associated protein|uniref:OmpA family protein n=1 Tax=Arenimonas sp. TaxID=1872635 RepID=UPI0037C059BA